MVISIPLLMVTGPQSDDMELFISIEEVQVSLKPVKKPMAVKKPRPEPVKEMVQPIEPSTPRIKPPEIIKPVKEVVKEPKIIEPPTPLFMLPVPEIPVKIVMSLLKAIESKQNRTWNNNPS